MALELNVQTRPSTREFGAVCETHLEHRRLDRTATNKLVCWACRELRSRPCPVDLAGPGCWDTPRPHGTRAHCCDKSPPSFVHWSVWKEKKKIGYVRYMSRILNWKILKLGKPQRFDHHRRSLVVACGRLSDYIPVLRRADHVLGSFSAPTALESDLIAIHLPPVPRYLISVDVGVSGRLTMGIE